MRTFYEPPVRQAVLAGMAAIVVLVASCASVPRPDAELATARTSIGSATQAGAGEFAPAPLQRARDSLARAERVMRDDNNNEEARRLAESAAVDAQLARSQSELAKTNQAASEIEKGLETLRRESQRKTN